MTKQEKLDFLSKAYVTKKVFSDSEKEITVINEALPKEIYKAMRDIQFTLNEETRTFDLDYSIMSDACNLLTELSLEEIEKEALLAADGQDSASPYT